MSGSEVEKPLIIGVPKGEMGSVVQQFLEGNPKLGIRYPDTRSLVFSSTKQRISIGIVRAKDLPYDVLDKNSNMVAGIVPSDAARNYRMPGMGQRVRELPVKIPPDKQSRVVLAVTENFWGSKPEGVKPEDLSGTTIPTSYPELAENFFSERGVEVNVAYRQGSIEAYGNGLMKNCVGVIDVTATGNSLKDNGLKEVAEIQGPIKIEFIYDRDKFRKMSREQRRQLAGFSRSLRRASSAASGETGK